MSLSSEVSDYSPAGKWSVRLAFFIGTYVLISFFLSPATFLTLGLIYVDKFARAVPILLVGSAAVAGLLYGRDAPTKYAINWVRTRWWNCLPVLLFFLAGVTAFSNFKILISDGPSVLCRHVVCRSRRVDTPGGAVGIGASPRQWALGVFHLQYL